MTSSRILQLNAAFTTMGAVAMFASRGILPALFGLTGPIVLDAIATGLLAYAVLLVAAARRDRVNREILLAFTVADAAWVLGSAIVLLVFWEQMAVVARSLLVAVALVVEVFAALQFRAAGRRTPVAA